VDLNWELGLADFKMNFFVEEMILMMAIVMVVLIGTMMEHGMIGLLP